jgi:hypothetical protein
MPTIAQSDSGGGRVESARLRARKRQREVMRFSGCAQVVVDADFFASPTHGRCGPTTAWQAVEKQPPGAAMDGCDDETSA